MEQALTNLKMTKVEAMNIRKYIGTHMSDLGYN